MALRTMTHARLSVAMAVEDIKYRLRQDPRLDDTTFRILFRREVRSQLRDFIAMEDTWDESAGKYLMAQLELWDG